MTDLDHLEDIAEANAFGFHGIGISPLHNAAHRHVTEACGGGHLWTDETTRWYKDKDRGRMRRICRICDKERMRKHKHKPKLCSSSATSIAQA